MLPPALSTLPFADAGIGSRNYGSRACIPPRKYEPRRGHTSSAETFEIGGQNVLDLQTFDIDGEEVLAITIFYSRQFRDFVSPRFQHGQFRGNRQTDDLSERIRRPFAVIDLYNASFQRSFDRQIS